MMKKNKNTSIKPYGDKENDGITQVSFTLQMPTDLAAAAGRELALKMGLAEPRVVHCEDIGNDFSFLVIYGKCTHTVDTAKLTVDKAVETCLGFNEINALIRKKVGRKITVIGACIESDAHTVGIDAILNMKGYHGNWGLERYPQFSVVNMGAQVPCELLIKKAREKKADVLLISQIVTQQNVHLHNLTRLIDLLEAENVRDRYLVIVGGPSIDNSFAKELGYDAGFGRGTLPSHVATFIVKRMIERLIKKDNGTK